MNIKLTPLFSGKTVIIENVESIKEVNSNTLQIITNEYKAVLDVSDVTITIYGT